MIVLVLLLCFPTGQCSVPSLDGPLISPCQKTLQSPSKRSLQLGQVCDHALIYCLTLSYV